MKKQKKKQRNKINHTRTREWQLLKINNFVISNFCSIHFWQAPLTIPFNLATTNTPVTQGDRRKIISPKAKQQQQHTDWPIRIAYILKHQNWRQRLKKKKNRWYGDIWAKHHSMCRQILGNTVRCCTSVFAPYASNARIFDILKTVKWLWARKKKRRRLCCVQYISLLLFRLILFILSRVDCVAFFVRKKCSDREFRTKRNVS